MRAPHLSTPEAIRIGEAMRLVLGSTTDARRGLVCRRRTSRTSLAGSMNRIALVSSLP